jgi:hypothetical protein
LPNAETRLPLGSRLNVRIGVELLEDHVQQHFYYFFDYRAKYPSNHLRLRCIANRIVPQHKAFLDEHGYEFREIPESDFGRRVAECGARTYKWKVEKFSDISGDEAFIRHVQELCTIVDATFSLS